MLVLHDFDVSGFSIFGTLGSDGRRYRFENELPIVDIGLRLADVEAMGLQSEPVETPGDWAKRAATLAAHGATEEEIAFLRRRRVELNAMPADVFVGFLERKLAEHGVRKVVPDRATLERHARRVIEQGLAEEALRENRARLQAEAASAALPADLDDRVRSRPRAGARVAMGSGRCRRRRGRRSAVSGGGGAGPPCSSPRRQATWLAIGDRVGAISPGARPWLRPAA